MHGVGVCLYTDGSRYQGDWKAGLKNGRGTHSFASGDQFEGEWENGWMHGLGVYTWKIGDKYIGEVRRRAPTASGAAHRIRLGGRRGMGEWGRASLDGLSGLSSDRIRAQVSRAVEPFCWSLGGWGIVCRALSYPLLGSSARAPAHPRHAPTHTHPHSHAHVPTHPHSTLCPLPSTLYLY